MKNNRLFLLFLSVIILSCAEKKGSVVEDHKEADLSDNSEWKALWNGENFDGWHKYLATPFNRVKDSLGNDIERFGIDNDPLNVISVVEMDDEKAIKITGVAWGMIYTEKDYENYHLKLKVKWGEAMHPPREKGPRDSGLLYHGFGEPGSESFWMSSQELQIQNGDFGDYWPTGDVLIDVPTVPKDDKFFIYQEGAELRTFHYAKILKTATEDSLAKRRVFKEKDAEKPLGEWNDVELIVEGDSSIHIVNGEVVMKLYNSRKASTGETLKSGKIIIQSEGAEVYYKDIYIKPIHHSGNLL